MMPSDPIPQIYSRDNPSPRYRQLLTQYQWLHDKGEPFHQLPPEKTFWGKSLPTQAPQIKKIIDLLGGVETILDYGSGKGLQYKMSPVAFKTGGETVRYQDIQSYWGVREIRCFDPAYAPFSALPADRYDGVICTDVLEHCPEEDIPWIVEELFSFSRRFVYASVACYPARKSLPTGENAHCTVMPVEWWKALVRSVAGRHPGLAWQFMFMEPAKDGSMSKRVISNLPISRDMP